VLLNFVNSGAHWFSGSVAAGENAATARHVGPHLGTNDAALTPCKEIRNLGLRRRGGMAVAVEKEGAVVVSI